jgi:hypothetical protein
VTHTWPLDHPSNPLLRHSSRQIPSWMLQDKEALWLFLIKLYFEECV